MDARRQAGRAAGWAYPQWEGACKDFHRQTHIQTASLCVCVCVHVYGYVRRCVGLYELRASFPQAIVGRTIAVATNRNSSNNLFSFSLHYGRGVVGDGWWEVGSTKPKELLKS